MKEQPGVMLYFENRECIEALSDADAGRLTKAILQYAQTGKRPQFEGVLHIVWLVLKPVIDRDAGRYLRLCQQKAYAVYCREQDKTGDPRLTYDEWCASETSSDPSRYPTTTTTTNTATTTTATANTTTTTTANTAAAPTLFESTDKINRLGANGRVILTNKDFFELRDEFGQERFFDLVWKAESFAMERGYDPDTLNWPKFLRHFSTKLLQKEPEED